MSSIGVDTLTSRISNVINIHREAGDVTNAEAIGVLEMVKLELFQRAVNEEDEDDGEG